MGYGNRVPASRRTFVTLATRSHAQKRDRASEILWTRCDGFRDESNVALFSSCNGELLLTCADETLEGREQCGIVLIMATAGFYRCGGHGL